VLQGERELARDCRSLARFDLKDVEPLPAGMARVEVRFLIDANGILNVTARDMRTGREQNVEVKPSYGLTDEQVEAMIQESMEMAEEDFKERQARDARVEADRILTAAEKAKQGEAYQALDDETKRQIEAALNRLLVVYHSEDHLLIRAAVEQLDRATMKLAESMMDSALRTALKGTKI
jgi:molecular chaperone DnaK (HSP70)